MSFDGFDEWDEKFLDQAIRLEEEVISTRSVTQSAPAVPPPSLHTRPNAFESASGDFSFSPPRELSQRPTETSFSEIDCEVGELEQRTPRRIGGSRHSVIGGKDKEIERLKRELGRVSKQLNHLEHECLELKRDRDKKDEHLKNAFSQLEAKDAEIHSLKRSNVDSETLMHNHPQMPLQPHCASSAVEQVGSGYPITAPKNNLSPIWAREGTSKRLSRNNKNSLQHDSIKGVPMDGSSSASELKHRMSIDAAAVTSNGHPHEEVMFRETSQPKFTRAIGIQTDASKDYFDSTVRQKLSAEYDLSEKLLAIWDSTCSNTSERNLASKLLTTCASDFCMLFRCTSMSSNITLNSPADESLSDVTLHHQMQSVDSVQAVEAAKISHLSDVLTKVNNGMLELDALFEALLDVCSLKNVAVVYRSLCILHVLLQHMLSFNKRPDSRDNVLVTSQNPSILKEEKRADGVQFSENRDEKLFAGLFSSIAGSSITENLSKGNGDFCCSTSLSSMLWMSLFETMWRIVAGNTEECLRVEATFIMNLILMRSNPYTERVKFGSIPLFESVSVLLQKEACSRVQKLAVHLLFLLLNCPKLFRMFCTGHSVDFAGEVDATKDPPAFRGSIMNGLADCLACRGNGLEELELRRHAVIVVAFIASSGKSGFEVVLNSCSSKGISILELIVQVLASEMDAEEAEPAESHDICKGRALLMREALILLNRLASNRVYFAAVLGLLTRSRAAASLMFDVSDRISRRGTTCRHSDCAKRTHMEAEIAGLSRVFRTRISSFLTGSSRGGSRGSC